ncbi:MAG: SH3 domain-containing protein [Clostridia bacterium]
MNENQNKFEKANAEVNEQTEAMTNETSVDVEKLIGIVKILPKQKLNVRETATLTANVKKTLSNGDIIEIDHEKSTEDFYKVTIDDIEGFCLKKHISLE